MPTQPATMEKHEFDLLTFNERINFNFLEGLFLGEFRYLSFDISLYRTPKFYVEIWRLPLETEIAHIESIHTDVRLDIYMKAISDLKVISDSKSVPH
jgi:hypothetical protein